MAKKTIKKKTTEKKPGLSDKINLPVTVGPDTLPLLDPNFEWGKFEKFSKDLISKIFEDTAVNIMGKKGEKQYGIDLIAENNYGISFFAQCKRYKTYSVNQFIKAKNELELKTDKCILLLACEAGSNLRLEALGDEKWEIWDVNDISSKVFSLSDKDRYDIIKRYFGTDWAKAFSSYNQFSSIVSPLEYFKIFLNPKKLFNHSIPYLGRDFEIEELKNFVRSNYQVLVLNAPGGIGKSRLLWEFSKSNDNSEWDTVFIKEEMKPLTEHFENIKSNKVLFIFDDAHRYDLSPYLAFIQMLNCKYKIIFSTRPQGRNSLKLSLKKLNIESQEVKDLELIHFSQESAKNIVHKLVPSLDGSQLWAMAKLMSESTLIGTLACNLVKRKSITLASLASDPDIKETIMFKFVEELSGKIESNISTGSIKNILNLISALAPIGYHNGNIEDEFLEVSSIPKDEIEECIADLLYSGLLVERGRQIRIAPDILSDCILEEACFLKNQRPSDFFNSLAKNTNEKLRKNLIKNISELDWRKKADALSNTVLLKEFWNGLNIAENEGLYSLSNKLDIIHTIAYFQPIESYNFAVRTFDYISKYESDDNDWYYSTCKETLIHIIRDIIASGYQVKHLMMILWELGKNDKRSLNSHPNHPIRQISDLCSYERYHPVNLYENTFEGLKEIIDVYNSGLDYQNPIEILSGFLAKSSHSTFSHGNSISWSPFHVSYDNTRELRSKVLELLQNLASSSIDLKKSYSAVNVLAKGMSPPCSMMGLRVGKEHIRVWSKEVRSITNKLIQVYKITPFNLVKLEIKKIFTWERRLNHYPSSKRIISNFLSEEPLCPSEIKYIPFLFSNYREILIKRELKDYKKMQERENAFLEDTISSCVSKFKNEKDFMDFGYKSMQELRSVGERPTSHAYSSNISNIPKFNNKNMCELLLENNSNALEWDFHLYLKKVAGLNIVDAIVIVKNSLQIQNIPILSSISQYYWWIFEKEVNNPNIQDLFKMIYNHKEEDVKVSSSWALKSLAKIDLKFAIECVLDFSVQSTNQAQALVSVLEPRYSIAPDNFSNLQLNLILQKIKDVNDVTHRNIQGFIDICSDRIPVELFEVLIYRVASKNNKNSEFVALPYGGFNKSLKLNVDDNKCIEIFEKITAILELEDADTFWLPTLFYDLAKYKYDLSLDYLNMLIKSDDLETVQAGLILLRKFNRNIVFVKQDWIRELLKHGKDKGKEYYDIINDYLYVLGRPTSKMGTAGEPKPQDIALIDNSKKAMESSKYDFEKNFYLRLKEHGEREIEEDKARNERRRC